jgi:CheY-like chemotaxis protein
MSRNGVPTVLVVDDEIDTRLLVRIVLQAADQGIKIIGEAVSGPEAMETFARLNPNEVPDVVILDHHLPEMEGIEVARELLSAHPDQHIVLFSNHLTPELEAEALEVGIAACVDKREVDALPDLVLSLASPREAS